LYNLKNLKNDNKKFGGYQELEEGNPVLIKKNVLKQENVFVIKI